MTKRKRYVLIRCGTGVALSMTSFFILKWFLPTEIQWVAPVTAMGIVFLNNITT